MANEEQLKLRDWLIRRDGYCILESVVSGTGLGSVFEFLTGSQVAPEQVATMSSHEAKESMRIWTDCLIVALQQVFDLIRFDLI